MQTMWKFKSGRFTVRKDCSMIRAIVTIAALAATIVAANAANPSRWSLVMEYRGDAFILDHGLTLGDCLAAMPRNDVVRHVSYACEVER